MQKQKLIGILRSLLACPTAPFHEDRVLAEIRAWLAPLPQITLREDRFGNLLAHFGNPRSRPAVAFVAHTDHPGFVRNPRTGTFDFLGGVPEALLATRHPTRDFGDFKMWDLPAFSRADDLVHSRACDDLAGCAALVAIAHVLAEREDQLPCAFVFTRAEEVGFVGAWEFAASGLLPHTTPIISVETSSERPPARMGQGPIIRVGDRASVFDAGLTAHLDGAAAGIPSQRCLMSGGTCEASAFLAAGYRAGGLCVALGNYHNVSPETTVAAEYISLADWLGLVHLGSVAAATRPQPRAARKLLASRIDKLRRDHRRYFRPAEPHPQY